MRRFVRVKDHETGHEYDVPETDWRIRDGLVTPVKPGRYPAAREPRRAKSHKSLGGKTAETQAAEPAEPTTHETGTTEEA